VREPGLVLKCRKMEDRVRRIRSEIVELARAGHDWVTFSTHVTELLRRLIRFDRSCWHSVDPGTVLLTGSLNQGIGCSGSWLAHHEFVVDDVNKWWFLARSGRQAGATSIATHGDLSRSARHVSHESFGIGDELRAALVTDGTYWGAVGILRDKGEPWFTESDVRTVASLSAVIAEGFRRALIVGALGSEADLGPGPGVVIFDEDCLPESISPAAEFWIDQLIEEPPPSSPADSRAVQGVAARAHAARDGQDPLELTARCRARTRTGSWLLLYGTRLSGKARGRTAVIIQPAPANEVAPLVALAYGLSDRERQLARLCIEGRSTKEMAQAMAVSAYTIQDHMKSIFEKTGARSRGELVGQVFLEHYVTRWDEVTHCPPGWLARSSTPVDGRD